MIAIWYSLTKTCVVYYRVCTTSRCELSTLISNRSAHWFRPVILMTPGHWHNKAILHNSKIATALLSLLRPFDKVKVTQGRGRWPRDLRKLGWFSCARHLEKSLHPSPNDVHMKMMLNAAGSVCSVRETVCNSWWLVFASCNSIIPMCHSLTCYNSY